VTTPDEFYEAARTRGQIRLTLVNPTDPGEPARSITLP